jgi:hypothetical protein
MPGPHLVRLTDQAAWRAERRGIGRDLIEALVLEAHEQRRVNKGGAAAWPDRGSRHRRSLRLAGR